MQATPNTQSSFNFGEVFLEERNNTWNTPFLFNGKELDEETGLYYYGARYYNPRTSIFYGCDPLMEEYFWQSPYAYAANNPVRFIDWNGEGPKDRVAIAKSFLGTPYKQETTKSLRTNMDSSALEYMDCSEFVSRVMAGDGITDSVEWKTSSQLSTELGKDFEKSKTPQEGDIIAWSGHAGIVESYDEDSQDVTVLHATRYTKKDGTKVEQAIREKYSLNYYSKKGAGFYHPRAETADVMGNTYDAGLIEGVVIHENKSAYIESIRPQINQRDANLQ
ncbi:MAG: RHS repeat-associated core domain-containing protein [Mangrovibacterium sp.]